MGIPVQRSRALLSSVYAPSYQKCPKHLGIGTCMPSSSYQMSRTDTCGNVGARITRCLPRHLPECMHAQFLDLQCRHAHLDSFCSYICIYICVHTHVGLDIRYRETPGECSVVRNSEVQVYSSKGREPGKSKVEPGASFKLLPSNAMARRPNPKPSLYPK